MTPFDYLDCYHSLKINDPLAGIATVVDIRRYISGLKPTQQNEENNLRNRLYPLLKLNGPYAFPPTFMFGDAAKGRVNPTEPFYPNSLHRAFEGRGSPDEIADAVRLAVISGYIAASDAKSYAEKWFGIDCNAFVGNYQGVSPSTAIFAYAHGYGSADNIIGATHDVYLSRDVVRIPPISNPSDIQVGYPILTFGSPDSGPLKSCWRHIALVQAFSMITDTKAIISIAEWGTEGGKDKHQTSDSTITLVKTPCRELPGKNMLGWSGKDPDGNPAVRYFFSARAFDPFDARGWQVANMDCFH